MSHYFPWTYSTKGPQTSWTYGTSIRIKFVLPYVHEVVTHFVIVTYYIKGHYFLDIQYYKIHILPQICSTASA